MNVYQYVKNYPWSVKSITIRGHGKWAVEDFVMLCIRYNTATNLANHLGCRRATITTATRKFKELDKSSTNISIKFLTIIGLKRCSSCKLIQEPSKFYKANKKDGHSHECKSCSSKRKKDWYYNGSGKKYHRMASATRRAALLRRTPKWADLSEIKEIYDKCPLGYHVDHIIPLQGEKVSGLHVHNNLQYLTPKENSAKKNKFLDLAP